MGSPHGVVHLIVLTTLPVSGMSIWYPRSPCSAGVMPVATVAMLTVVVVGNAASIAPPRDANSGAAPPLPMLRSRHGAPEERVTSYLHDYITVGVFAAAGFLLVAAAVGLGALLRPGHPPAGQCPSSHAG